MKFEVLFYLDGKNHLINWLMYKSYEYQRDSFPDVESSRWRRLYFNQSIYEKIYQEYRR
ncbi:hypothetical protein LCGC14_1232520 [marine sediment metagenome]|uniref:Uncharacterized protein n=1 Tax=marine sediment metagenome TaxID=412755 RepID=A0A0F9NQD3_9ZZZZ